MMNFIRKLFGLFKSKPQLDVVYDFQTFNTRTIMHEGDGKPYELKPGNGKGYYSIPDPGGCQPCLKCKSRRIKLEKSFKGSENFQKATCKKCGFIFIVEV